MEFEISMIDIVSYGLATGVLTTDEALDALRSEFNDKEAAFVLDQILGDE